MQNVENYTQNAWVMRLYAWRHAYNIYKFDHSKNYDCPLKMQINPKYRRACRLVFSDLYSIKIGKRYLYTLVVFRASHEKH